MRKAALTLAPVILAVGTFAQTPQVGPKLTDSELREVVTKLDAQMYAAYNACDLDAFAAMLAPDVDAYHDLGGHAVGRDTLKGLVQQHICTGRHVRRELVTDTLDVSPIPGVGAVQTSASVFWERQPNGSEVKSETAKEVKLWRQREGVWQLAIWISYDHRRLP
jgi:ketosteroid isomerase-like protein